MASIVNITDFASRRRPKTGSAPYCVVAFPYGSPIDPEGLAPDAKHAGVQAAPSLMDELRSVNNDMRNRMAQADREIGSAAE